MAHSSLEPMLPGTFQTHAVGLLPAPTPQATRRRLCRSPHPLLIAHEVIKPDVLPQNHPVNRNCLITPATILIEPVPFPELNSSPRAYGIYSEAAVMGRHDGPQESYRDNDSP